MRRRRWRRLRRGIAGVALIAIAAVVALQGWYFAWVVYYADHPPRTTAFMELRRAGLAEGGRLRHEWTDYEAISHWLKRAVVAAEDARFMQHGGIDWEALQDALQENLAADGIARGGSTITQQLAKNLFLSPRRSYLRKAQEAAIAYMLETVLTKKRILELYLNVIEWGEARFGAAAAAQHYYGRSPATLSRWQAAMLAARIPRPRFYDRNGTTPFLLERAGDIHGWSGKVRIP